MNSKNFVVAALILILLVGGVYVIYKRTRQVSPPPPIENTLTNSTPSPTASPARELTIDLKSQNGSSESGTARIREEGGKVIVTLMITNSPASIPQPAHIHVGKCPDVGLVKYQLSNLINGKSETTLETTLDNLTNQLPLAINVHKSVPQATTYVSCGEIVK